MGGSGNSGMFPETIKRRIIGLLASSKLPYILFFLAAILSAPSLWMGIYLDDYMQRMILLGKPILGFQINPLSGLFDFIPKEPERLWAWRDAGLIQWWAHPEIRAGFFRPLTAATHMLDYFLWPDNFAMQHAQSIVWYGLGVMIIALVYRRVFKNAAAAGLAALMFAVEDSHAMPAAWLANRNSLLALFFAGLALLMHIEWRQGRRFIYLPLALTAFAASLLSGEAGLGIIAYFFAYQLILDKGSLIKRMAYLVPYGIIVMAWRAAYQALGFGAIGSDIYLDPMTYPRDFSLAVIERIPVLMLSQWLQFPVDLWMIFLRNYQLVLTAAGAVVMVMLGLLFRCLLKESAEARFWGLGMLVSLVPLCAGPPMDRMLIFAGIGAFGLLAGQADKLFLSESKGGRLLSWAVGILLLIHVIIAPVLLPVRIWSTVKMFDIFKSIERAMPNDQDLKKQSLILLQGNEIFVSHLPFIRTLEGGVVPKRISFLAQMWRKMTVKRLDDSTLLIRPVEGFIPRPVDRFFRHLDPPFKPGQKIECTEFTVEVLEVTPDGRPAAAAFRFKLPFDDPSLRLIYFGPKGIDRFKPPELGAETTFPGVLDYFFQSLR